MFKSLKAKNFQSWKELEFDFISGVTLIQGWNKDDNTAEGSGKSAVLNALCWALYGRLPKDTNIDDVISHGERSCTVEIELEKGEVIVRSRGPNDLFWITPYAPDINNRGSSSKDTQRMIENMIGMSFITFCSTVYFSQNNPYRFITATEEEKAKILSEIQDLSLFDKARDKTKEEMNELEKDKIKLLAEYQRNQLLLQGREREYKTLKQLVDDHEKMKQYKIEQVSKEINSFETKLNELVLSLNGKTVDTSTEEELVQQIMTKQEIISKRQKLSMEKRTKERDLVDRKEKLDHLAAGTCPTCKQMYVNNSMIETLAKAVEQIKSDLSKIGETDTKTLDFELQELNKVYLLVKNNKKEVNALALQKNLCDSNLEGSKRRLKDLKEANVDDVKEKLKGIQDYITDHKDDLVSIEKELNEKLKEIQDLTILREGFKEIKKYVFQSLMDNLNVRINGHLASLFEMPINAEFTNTGEEGELSKIQVKINLAGQELSFGLLSGGQAKRVELSACLALNDVIKNRSSNPLNLRIFDEPFTNLSEESMSKMVDLLQKQEGCTILIEHNSTVKGIVNNVFDIEYVNGQSKRLSSSTLQEQEGSGTQMGPIRQSKRSTQNS